MKTKMNKLKHICAILLVFLLVAATALPCCCATESGKLTVLLEDKNKDKLSGTTVHLCRIAELNNSGYFPTPDFENSGISLSAIINNPDDSSAKAVAEYVKANSIKTLTGVSDNGKASFENLGLGIWLVFCDNNSRYTFNPYIVFLPYETNGKVYYEISSSPKTEDNASDKINIYVVKKWDDKNNAAKKRPGSVAVELLNGNTVIDSVLLNDNNGWSYTFAGLDKHGDYSVREKNVKNYKASYGGDKTNGFVITNSYAGEKLPQTGQYWWPIIAISIAGGCFVLLGIYEIGVKKNDKKK